MHWGHQLECHLSGKAVELHGTGYTWMLWWGDNSRWKRLHKHTSSDLPMHPTRHPFFFFAWGLCTISVCTRGARQVNKAKKERRLWEDIITGRTSQPLPGGKGRRAEDGGCCLLLLCVKWQEKFWKLLWGGASGWAWGVLCLTLPTCRKPLYIQR